MAHTAEVSVATASRALRDVPHVAPETRARVRAAAAALGYRADPAGGVRTSGGTRTVAVAVPVLGTWYAGQLLAGAEAVLRPAGCDLLVVAVGPHDRHRFVEHVRGRVDAVALLGTRLDAADAAALAVAGVAVVGVGERHPWWSSIRVDDEVGARLATSHLLHLGHRRIGLLTGEPEPAASAGAGADRRRGHHAALAAVGIGPDRDLEVSGAWTVAGGTAGMHRLLAVPDPPTAVFALSDEMAFGALRGARDHGLRVPEDVSVVGFDDHDVADVLRLTTVAQRPADLGRRAADLLVAALDRSAPPRHEVVATRLVVRASTGRPRA